MNLIGNASRYQSSSPRVNMIKKKSSSPPLFVCQKIGIALASIGIDSILVRLGDLYKIESYADSRAM